MSLYHTQGLGWYTFDDVTMLWISISTLVFINKLPFLFLLPPFSLLSYCTYPSLTRNDKFSKPMCLCFQVCWYRPSDSHTHIPFHHNLQAYSHHIYHLPVSLLFPKSPYSSSNKKCGSQTMAAPSGGEQRRKGREDEIGSEIKVI